MTAPRVLVTGAAGFIGSAVAASLAARGWAVVGCDNFNDYYSPALKADRVGALLAPAGVACHPVELADPVQVAALFRDAMPTHVIHLAAQAGVRHSLDHPEAYVRANLLGFANMLEACRRWQPRHFVYASSSSVYGASAKVPFQEDERTDAPLSFYAATKKANEVMAHSYNQLFGVPTTGLRLFTVYGPWGRPDMACFQFAGKMRGGEAIPVYAGGNLSRDFTYIDDVVDAVVRLLPLAPGAHRIVNIGSARPVPLFDFIDALARALHVRPRLALLPMQAGDMAATWADTGRLRQLVGHVPSTPLATGLADFAAWFDAHGQGYGQAPSLPAAASPAPRPAS